MASGEISNVNSAFSLLFTCTRGKDNGLKIKIEDEILHVGGCRTTAMRVGLQTQSQRHRAQSCRSSRDLQPRPMSLLTGKNHPANGNAVLLAWCGDFQKNAKLSRFVGQQKRSAAAGLLRPTPVASTTTSLFWWSNESCGCTAFNPFINVVLMMISTATVAPPKGKIEFAEKTGHLVVSRGNAPSQWIL